MLGGSALVSDRGLEPPFLVRAHQNYRVRREVSQSIPISFRESSEKIPISCLRQRLLLCNNRRHNDISARALPPVRATLLQNSCDGLASASNVQLPVRVTLLQNRAMRAPVPERVSLPVRVTLLQNITRWVALPLRFHYQSG